MEGCAIWTRANCRCQLYMIAACYVLNVNQCTYIRGEELLKISKLLALTTLSGRQIQQSINLILKYLCRHSVDTYGLVALNL